jgi:putative SOS response-associated peptidase YedK
MCNLYTVPSADEFEKYMRQLDSVLDLDEPDWPTKPVGPFGVGAFVRPHGAGLKVVIGQWGLIRPGQPERIDHIQPKAVAGKKPPAPKARSTNNARIEGIDTKPTFAPAWRNGQRCLIPAAWYAEPNWETGRNIWWHLRRADGQPWMLAGLWSEWVDPQTGEVVPNFTMITCNCDFHPLLGRLHRPERDPKTGEVLPADRQDKRSLVHVAPGNWAAWLTGTNDAARALVQPPPAEAFDPADALRTDAILAAMTASSSGTLF